MPSSAVENTPGAYIFITHNFSLNEKKYGEFGYRLALLEAGHIGQNFYLVSTATNLGYVALGMGNFDVWRSNQLLKIDGVDTSIIHTLAIGHAKNQRCRV